jgi:putative superfamily III holin-X
MALERLKAAAIPHALTDVVGDLADLVQKEMRLARAEVVSKLSLKLTAGIWFAAAGVLALFAFIALLQAAVFGIANFGVPLHWSCLIVAGVLAAIAAALFLKGRADAKAELTPERTIHQLKQDIATAKEQMT